MGLLSFLPTAEDVINPEQVNFRETILEFSSNGWIGRTVKVLTGQTLGIIAVKLFKISRCHLYGAMLTSTFVNQCDRRLCQDADAWNHNFKLALAQFLYSQEGFIFPGQEDITDATLYKSIGCTACT